MIDYLEDLESDFSAIHRVDDIYAMDGPRFFKLAYRIVHYQGAIRAAVEAEAEKRHRKYKGNVEQKSLSELRSTQGGAGLFRQVRV